MWWSWGSGRSVLSRRLNFFLSLVTSLVGLRIMGGGGISSILSKMSKPSKPTDLTHPPSFCNYTGSDTVGHLSPSTLAFEWDRLSRASDSPCIYSFSVRHDSYYNGPVWCRKHQLPYKYCSYSYYILVKPLIRWLFLCK